MNAGQPWRIGVMPGDGVGPETVEQGLRVLDAVRAIDGLAFELRHYPHSGAHYRATGELISDETIDEIGRLDALFFGASGDPSLPLGTMERAMRHLRERLDLSVGIRPARLHAAHLTPLKNYGPGDIDLLLVRETSEDCYPAPGGTLRPDTSDEVSIGLLVYTRKSVERTVRYAVDRALERTGRIALVTQANAVPSHTIWVRTTAQVAADYAAVEVRQFYADSGALALLTEPHNLDVILTPYWIGGILSEIMGGIVGGIGLIGDARVNLDRHFGIFQSAHGSAPKYAGQNRVSPMATLSALALMLAHLGETTSAARIETAIAHVLSSGKVPNVSARGPMGTLEATDAVIEQIQATANQPVGAHQ
jgi:isocitrate/isopropylmalate dehydrogenase